MIDTVKLRSPHLSAGDAALIEGHCLLRQAVEIATGDVQYSLTTRSLKGSYDAAVSVRVMREEIITSPNAGAVVMQPCEPYILVEGSVHKALLGHNVHGGPLSPLLACCWFIDDLSYRLGVSLPYGGAWQVQRIDWAEVYELPSFEAVQEYISGLNRAEFPRRKVYRYGDESIFSPGRTTAIKAYHKGPEFYKHDRKRLRDCLSDGELVELQERANRLLRFETSIKARKLAEDFGGKPLVVQMRREYLEGLHDREAARLLKEANVEMETVRTHLEVSRRLQHTYSQELANRLFGTWMQLATLGEGEVRKHMTRPTFFRQRKQLTDAGCAWNAADVQIVARHSAIPLGFAPVRSDPRRLTVEADQVKYKLQIYQRAA